MNSTVGRPRLLSDSQVQAILEWHQNYKSASQLARELRVCKSTIWNAIRRNGQYKQASPDQRPTALAVRRRRMDELRANGFMS